MSRPPIDSDPFPGPARRQPVQNRFAGRFSHELRGKLRARAWGPVLLAFLVALGLNGCAGYRLGPTNGLAAGAKSVQVNPFLNQTLEPGLGDWVTQQTRKQLQRDGTYSLASHDDGDIIVSGVITRYFRVELTFVPNDILTVSDYQVGLTAKVTARERATGNLILKDESVTGYTLVRVGNDLTSAERQAMPLLAEDLAKKVTALLADGKW